MIEKIVFLMVGPPASGKSTIVQQLLETNDDLRVICPDNIRFYILDSNKSKIFFLKEIEDNVLQISYNLLDAYLKVNKSVIFDACNITKNSRKNIIEIAKRNDAMVYCKYIIIDKQLASRRNENRERNVPEYALSKKFNEMEPPETGEGIDYIETIHFDTEKRNGDNNGQERN